jgi:hypothetical protein
MFNVTTISTETIIRTAAGIVATTAGRGDIDMVGAGTGVVQRD